jgi:hypothetical protein
MTGNSSYEKVIQSVRCRGTVVNGKKEHHINFIIPSDVLPPTSCKIMDISYQMKVFGKVVMDFFHK